MPEGSIKSVTHLDSLSFDIQALLGHCRAPCESPSREDQGRASVLQPRGLGDSSGPNAQVTWQWVAGSSLPPQEADGSVARRGPGRQGAAESLGALCPHG